MKEPHASKGWVTRIVDTFSPRLFAAINPPDATLASRAIVVPLIRTDHDAKRRRDPANEHDWPYPRQSLVDDLWAMGLAHLSQVSAYLAKAKEKTVLSGRDLEPWLAVLTTALWLEDEGHVDALFTRLNAQSVVYQEEREDSEEFDLTRYIFQALENMTREDDRESDVSDVSDVSAVVSVRDVLTREVVAEVKGLLESHGVGAPGLVTERRLGRQLRNLGFKQGPRSNHGRKWRISSGDVRRNFLAWYPSMEPLQMNSTNDTHVTLDTNMRESGTWML